MRTPSLPEQDWRIETFQRATTEPAHVAVAYLEAEEWDVLDALVSYRGDQLAAQSRLVGKSAGACAFAPALTS